MRSCMTLPFLFHVEFDTAIFRAGHRIAITVKLSGAASVQSHGRLADLEQDFTPAHNVGE